MADYSVYIDESGDLGIKKGTQWFVISAVVVKKSDESDIRRKINEIRTKLNIHEIHFKDIREFQKKAYVVREISSEKFCYMNVLVDTNLFDETKIPDSLIAYNYACKFLLERVTWYLNDLEATADIVLSSRGTSRDGDLITYIKDKLLNYPNNEIIGSTITNVTAKSASTWDLLQLADICATTTFLTYEENKNFGFCVPCFSMALVDHLYKNKKDGRIISYGMKFFKNEMKPDIKELRKKRICAKKERTPGATTT